MVFYCSNHILIIYKMKKLSFRFLSLMVLSLALVACSNPSKMAKYASMVTTNCEPQVLEAVAGKIDATYSVTFPGKYFLKKAILEITPVMVYQGGEVAGETFTLQGEKVLENYTTVPFEQGGTYKRNVSFNYVPGMEKAVLELRATVYNKTKTKKFVYPAPFKIADGTNTTYMLVCTEGTPTFEADNYQKIIKEQKESQILYVINQAEVRNSQLTKKEIKEFEEFLKSVANDERRTLTSNDIIAYASPDGRETLNASLSEKRMNTATKAFQKKIAKKNKTALDADLNASHVNEDWEGFQELVSASNIEDKELILRVLSMYSDPAVREQEIKNMSSVFQILADKILPQLRRARIIANVDYKNWTDDEINDMIENNIDELDEEALLYAAATLKKNPADKMKLYEQAAKKYNSSRAYNNMAVLYLIQGKAADAKSALDKMSEKTPSYYNNMGVVAMQQENYKAAADYLSKSNLPEAKYNQAALDILNGKYQQAVAALAGTGAENEALAYLLVGENAKAGAAIHCKCPKSNYLRAIVAARQGNSAAAKEFIEKASKDEKLAARAKNDIEFAKL